MWHKCPGISDHLFIREYKATPTLAWQGIIQFLSVLKLVFMQQEENKWRTFWLMEYICGTFYSMWPWKHNIQNTNFSPTLDLLPNIIPADALVSAKLNESLEGTTRGTCCSRNLVEHNMSSTKYLLAWAISWRYSAWTQHLGTQVAWIQQLEMGSIPDIHGTELFQEQNTQRHTIGDTGHGLRPHPTPGCLSNTKESNHGVETFAEWKRGLMESSELVTLFLFSKLQKGETSKGSYCELWHCLSSLLTTTDSSKEAKFTVGHARDKEAIWLAEKKNQYKIMQQYFAWLPSIS